MGGCSGREREKDVAGNGDAGVGVSGGVAGEDSSSASGSPVGYG